MTLSEDPIVFGLAGAFGSGCTTLAETLESDRGFCNVKLSNLILRRWREGHVRHGGTEHDPVPREALQDLGDGLRRFHADYAFWARRAVESAESSEQHWDRLVLDGIRNPGEVEWLASKFSRFYLVAVDAPQDERWVRLRDTAAWRGRTKAEFDEVSRRDIDAEIDWGQKVQECIDLADFVITNDNHAEVPEHRLVKRIDDLLELVSTGDGIRKPFDDEFFMHLAYSNASGSACLKRQVGAVIVGPAPVNGRPETISHGYNENPSPIQPCHDEYGRCYRDIWRAEQLERMAIERCPRCSAKVTEGYPPHCINPECPNHKGLLAVLFPERAMTHCTAIHAEVRAILAADRSRLSGSTMYSTTFPCFLCTEQIINAGIERIVYVEAYPDRAAEQNLARAGVRADRFSGVKSRAYDRIFGSWRARALQNTR